MTRVLIDTTRRRERLDHHRRLGEHHRGVLAGPFRLDRLRSRPRRPGPTPAERQPADARSVDRPGASQMTHDPAQLRAHRRGGPGPSGVPAAHPGSTGARTGWPSCAAPSQPRGRELGSPGPDQGYALLLAHELFADTPRADRPASRPRTPWSVRRRWPTARAALFGRAPVAKDIELALVLFGFLGGAPDRSGGLAGPAVPGRRPPLPAAAQHRRGRARGDAAPDARPRSAAGSRTGAMLDVSAPPEPGRDVPRLI